jgi:CheY-like chemotaxis protein
VMQYLKQDPSTAAIPVHFISAVDEAERGRAMGAIGYLTKPVDRKSLQAAFDRMLDVAGKIVRKLLVVDKDPESREALVQLVRNEKVEIDEAASGAEALERIEATRYDCIVLDLDLDDMSSNRFLEAASSAHPLPPVVIYSGRELAREESLKLRQYTDSIVIKGERSPERLLDEISLFLHSLGHRPNHVSEARHGDDLAGRTILLVDDDMRNLFALSKALRARGLSVLMAQDGFKALHQLDEHPEIGLVVMDIMMPGMDGYETIREIRKQEQWAKLPIIAVTAKAMPGDRDKCLEAGANDYLAKPVDMDKLTSMMRVWMQA